MQLDPFAIAANSHRDVIHTYCCKVVVLELTFCELFEQAALPHPGAADHTQFENVIELTFEKVVGDLGSCHLLRDAL